MTRREPNIPAEADKSQRNNLRTTRDSTTVNINQEEYLMIMTRTQTVISRILQIIVALILFQTLFFKFTGAEESKYIFSTVLNPEMEAVGRIGSGLVELVAVVLLLLPRTVWLGASLAFGTISGAIFSHLTVLGIE